MTLGAEQGLMLLALALYVYDASLLLRPDELALVQGRGGRWQPVFGVHGWKLAGKEPLLPNLAAPWQGLVRVRWSFELGLSGEPSPGGPQLPGIGLLPRIGVTLLLGLVFVALPLCLFLLPVTALALGVVAAIYAGCVFVLVTLRRDACGRGLGRRAFWTLCAECLACPPFCINAVRRVSLLAPVRVTLADIAAQAESQGGSAGLKRELARRVVERIELEQEGSERMRRLERVARALRAEDDA